LVCLEEQRVPYCGDYLEANTWSKKEQDMYAHFAAKRQRMQRREAANIRAWIEHREMGQ